MKTTWRPVFAVLLLLAAAGSEGRQRAVRHLGDCTAITGELRNAGLAYEEGDRVVTSPYRRTPNVSGDMVLLSDGRTLLALEGSRLFRSRDDGCSWIEAGVLPHGATAVYAGAGGRAFAVEGCCIEETSIVHRIDGDTIVRLTMPRANLSGFGTDPVDPDRVRAAFETYGGLEIWESRDGGGHWQPSGPFVCATGCTPGLWKLAFFDPADPDHVVAAMNGATALFVSRDGGTSWTPALGLRTFGSDFGIWSVTFTGQGGLWAVGMQRHGEISIPTIWRSLDGGIVFRLELEAGNGVYVTPATRVTPSRTNPDVAYFGAGDLLTNTSWLYRYDAATRSTTIREHHLGFRGISAIVQSPRKPEMLHLLFDGPHCEFLCAQ